jgi:hypothetical protein
VDYSLKRKKIKRKQKTNTKENYIQEIKDKVDMLKKLAWEKKSYLQKMRLPWTSQKK